MWVATFRYFVDHAYDFEGVSEDDLAAILEEVDLISNRLLKKDSFTMTLPRIVEYVTKVKQLK